MLILHGWGCPVHSEDIELETLPREEDKLRLPPHRERQAEGEDWASSIRIQAWLDGHRKAVGGAQGCSGLSGGWCRHLCRPRMSWDPLQDSIAPPPALLLLLHRPQYPCAHVSYLTTVAQSEPAPVEFLWKGQLGDQPMLWRELDQGLGKWGPFSCLRAPSGLGGTATDLGGPCGCFLSTSVGLWWSPSLSVPPAEGL